MPLRMVFTAAERQKLGVLVNNITIFATQLLTQSGGDVSTRALANLARVKTVYEDLLKRLDELAREHGDESPLRLIEDRAMWRRCSRSSAVACWCRLSWATVSRSRAFRRSVRSL